MRSSATMLRAVVAVVCSSHAAAFPLFALEGISSGPHAVRSMGLAMQERQSCVTDRRTAVALAGAGCLTGLLPRVALADEVESKAEIASVPTTEEVAEPASSLPVPRKPSAFDFDVPFRGEPVDSKTFLGAANLVVNVKFDDPETLEQLPALSGFVSSYAKKGFHVLAFPTDQGWFEAEDSSTLRLKFKSIYDFGQYPSAVVFDKADLLGLNQIPFYRWLTASFPNPWGVNRIVFNYEKFLLDAEGRPVRRYPRKFRPELIEVDIKALLEGRELPPESALFKKAWEDAKREAIKSEYAFKPGLNYYSSGSPAS